MTSQPDGATQHVKGGKPCWCGGQPAYGIPHRDLPADAITAAAEANDAFYAADLDIAYPSDQMVTELARRMLEAAAPHLAATERQRSKRAQDQAVTDALEAERERLREPVAIVNAWSERLPDRHVPLRVREALLRLRNLTTPSGPQPVGADAQPGDLYGPGTGQ